MPTTECQLLQQAQVSRYVEIYLLSGQVVLLRTEKTDVALALKPLEGSSPAWRRNTSTPVAGRRSFREMLRARRSFSPSCYAVRPRLALAV